MPWRYTRFSLIKAINQSINQSINQRTQVQHAFRTPAARPRFRCTLNTSTISHYVTAGYINPADTAAAATSCKQGKLSRQRPLLSYPPFYHSTRAPSCPPGKIHFCSKKRSNNSHSSRSVRSTPFLSPPRPNHTQKEATARPRLPTSPSPPLLHSQLLFLDCIVKNQSRMVCGRIQQKKIIIKSDAS